MDQPVLFRYYIVIIQKMGYTYMIYHYHEFNLLESNFTTAYYCDKLMDLRKIRCILY